MGESLLAYAGPSPGEQGQLTLDLAQLPAYGGAPSYSPDMACFAVCAATASSPNRSLANSVLPPLDIDDEYWVSLRRPIMAPPEQAERQHGEVPGCDTPLPPLVHTAGVKLRALDQAGRLAVEVGGDTQPLRILTVAPPVEHHPSALEQLRGIAGSAQGVAFDRVYATWRHVYSDVNRGHSALSDWFTKQRTTFRQEGARGLLRNAVQAAAGQCSTAAAELKHFALDQAPATTALTLIVTAMWLEDAATSSIGRSFKARSPMPFIHSLTLPLVLAIRSLGDKVMHDVRAMERYSAPRTSPSAISDDEGNGARRSPNNHAQRRSLWSEIDETLGSLRADHALPTEPVAGSPREMPHDTAEPGEADLVLGDSNDQAIERAAEVPRASTVEPEDDGNESPGPHAAPVTTPLLAVTQVLAVGRETMALSSDKPGYPEVRPGEGTATDASDVVSDVRDLWPQIRLDAVMRFVALDMEETRQRGRHPVRDRQDTARPDLTMSRETAEQLAGRIIGNLRTGQPELVERAEAILAERAAAHTARAAEPQPSGGESSDRDWTYADLLPETGPWRQAAIEAQRRISLGTVAREALLAAGLQQDEVVYAERALTAGLRALVQNDETSPITNGT